MSLSGDEREWCRAQFEGARLSDVRRNRRVLTVAMAMAENPGKSIPRLFKRAYDVKAAYNLFNHPEATPDSLQAGHRDLVKHRMHEPGVVLLLEDTTEVSWFSDEAIEGLGPVGNGHELAQGFLLHSVVAVRWPQEPVMALPRPPLDVLGIATQEYYIRKPIPEGEADDDLLARQKRARESQLWERASECLGRPPKDVRWVRICDRGADIYEFLRGCQELGHGFVIRAAQDRALQEPKGRLFERARQASSLGQFQLELRSRPRHPARTATLSVSAQRVTLRSPQRPGYSTGRLPALPCTVVRVWEAHPPEGIAPLEWILLTDTCIETFEQAVTCVSQYATRWTIEEFHKALKTVLGAERLQLETAHRLFAAVSIMSVLALRLVDLKERVRLKPDAPAEASGLDALELKVLSLHLNRQLLTVADVALAIGRLGGHMNRRADGMPGVLTLGRGLIELQALVAGARLGLQLRDLGND